MNFGKRGVSPATTASPASLRPAGKGGTPVTPQAFKASHAVWVVFAAFLAIGGTLGISLLQGRLIGGFVEDSWSSRGSLPYDKFVTGLASTLDAERDKVELAIHGKCQKKVLSGLKPLNEEIRKEYERTWPRLGGTSRVSRIADYVVCTITDTPSRFCVAPVRERLMAHLQGYFEVQAYERKVDEVARTIYPATGADLTTDGLPLKIITDTDPRIAGAIRQLVRDGIVAPAELEGSLPSKFQSRLQKIFNGITPGVSPCA